ncbi:hypothetical protein BDV93DRAFT_225287 [Ceratobasidium sp. AG-I]|nr:hypothetical protein BDV93DRAFT_225287 [Ceratobasidium sp. AG-I]
MPQYSFEELAKSNELDECDSIDPLNALATLENYYRIFFALVRGHARRVGLPVELAIYIWQYVRFCCPYPDQRLSIRYLRRNVPSEATNRSYAAWKPLMKTPPLLKNDLNSLGRIEISMNYVQNREGFHDTFRNEFQLRVSPQDTERLPYFVMPHFWRFIKPGTEPESPGPATPVANPTSQKSDFQQLVTLNLDHEIWDDLIPGDGIEVMVATYSAIVENCGFEGEIRVFKIWEPSYEMLRLA